MDREIPGISVPAEVIERVAGASDEGEAAYQQVLEQCQHALSLPGVAGLHLTDFRHDGSLGRLVDDLGLGSRSAERDAS
jgi:methylenetetrahydrofolate reductase (NADPH)